ncbi:oligosaccharide flippase family protein [Heyndrickxia faecalis]|uniref:Oligosaccharide flippase family protein n=1 Tax=Heyndrickxia faecalis TaxID=2824910 RepID=A0AAU7WH63_9BACI|nr:oligosaccharide flippase family protein [Heyndrickxia coagulans]
MNSYKKLASNSIIFAIGNLGTKFISFILVPLYSYTLNTSEYGLTDMITTTTNMLIPLISLSIYDAVLRFAMDKNSDHKEVLSNGLVVMFTGFLIFILLAPFLAHIQPFSNYIIQFYLLLFFQMLNTLFLQFMRAIGQIKLFALSGIISSIVTLISAFILLYILSTGIVGYFTSLTIANVISCIMIIIFGKILGYIDIKRLQLKVIKMLIKYSIPLMPNSFMWWVMNASDRYLISYFLGLSANGIYAVANKIPSLLNIVNSIFFQAWQLSAIEEANSKDKSLFYSKVFNMISAVMFLTTSFLLLFLKLIMRYFVSENYYVSWRYSPFLFLGVVFSCFSAFIGTNYIANKDTYGVFKTSVVGAIINFGLNLILIPMLGINGASISTMVSFATIWVLRIVDTRNFVRIKVEMNTFILNILIVSSQIALLYLVPNRFAYICQAALFLLMLFVNKSIMYLIYKLTLKITNIIRHKFA